MKKIITIILGLALSTQALAYSTLYEYYMSEVGYFPTIADRVETAQEYGIENYKGTASQNVALLSALSGGEQFIEEDNFVFGGFRPSGYTGKLLTRLTEGGSESTFNTTPGTAPDGTSLTTAKIGDFIVITVNPGAANEEKISASAVSVSGTTATWTIINRGLSFTENVAVTANKKQHAIGETVIISNDDHYLSSQYPAKDEDAVITGTWTFSVFPVTPDNAVASTSGPGIVEIATKAEVAAGTSAGGGGSYLVIPAAYATSTSQVATTSVVVTNTSGKIDHSFGLSPTGTLMAYASTTAPDGWLLADGSAVSRTTYADLYSLLGTSYGVGDGSTTFNLPDVRGRAIVMASSTQSALQGLDRATLGATGTTTSHTLTSDQMPVHVHDVAGIFKDGGGSTGTGTSDQTNQLPGTVTSTSAGGGAAHNILDPYIILNYIIKY